MVSETKEFLIVMLGTTTGATILNVLLLYGIHNVGSHFNCVVIGVRYIGLWLDYKLVNIS